MTAKAKADPSARRERVLEECRELAAEGVFPSIDLLRETIADIPRDTIRSLRAALIADGLVDAPAPAPDEGPVDAFEIRARTVKIRNAKVVEFEREARRRLNTTPVPTVCDRRTTRSDTHG